MDVGCGFGHFDGGLQRKGSTYQVSVTKLVVEMVHFVIIYLCIIILKVKYKSAAQQLSEQWGEKCTLGIVPNEAI